MARRLLLAATGVIALAAAGLGTTAANAAAPAASSAKITTVHSCAKASRGHAQCYAVARIDAAAAAATARMASGAKGGVNPNVTPSGYGPTDLRSAYKLTTSGSSSQTVAIVDAYDDPTAEPDLGTYRSQYGLPACTTANGCFKKVNQNGVQGSYPRTDGGWAQEISLDLDMASAICPGCHILLVEATTPSFANLGAAVNRAAAMGATVISNSYGGSDASDASYGSYYRHPGIAVTVSSGDNGYGVEYPASSYYVTAVGGTHLVRSSTSRGWTETAWSGAGSGCSAYNTKPSWQTATSCSRRAVADVSAVADPATGVAVYDSTAYQGLSGWLVFGGTSVSSPIIASVYALAGNAASVNYGSYPYGHTSSLFDVTSGSNGSCSTTKWCHAVAGWDGPTGLGTPNGTGAF